MQDLKTNDLFEIEEKNKKELAENLHDHLGQALAIIRLNLKKIQGNAVFCGIDGEINDALSLTEKCIKYSRDLVTELSPLILHKFGLIPALESLIENFQIRHRIKIECRHEIIPSLDENQRIYLYRSINELLVNVIKHAQASRILVSLLYQNHRLKILIEDDGVGINQDQIFGFGLMSVQERIYCLKGLFTIVPLKKGTLASIELPLPLNQDANENN